MSYRLSTPAHEDILNIYIESYDYFGQTQAEKYMAGLKQSLNFLDQNPLASSERLSCQPPVRVHPYRSHIIIYRVESFGIWIMRICHARENWIEFDWASFPDD